MTPLLAKLGSVQVPLNRPAAPAEIPLRKRVELWTLVFTDLVGSTHLKQQFGDRAAADVLRQHHALVRRLLDQIPGATEIETAGDSFFLVFAKSSEAVRFALRFQADLRRLAEELRRQLSVRVGIHRGEVVVDSLRPDGRPAKVFGIAVDACARVMSLAAGGQILVTRPAFDDARGDLREDTLEGAGGLAWLNHGPYQLKGVEDPLEICEVGEAGLAPLAPPEDSEKVRRHTASDLDPVPGWRPALEQTIPGTRWILQQRLGEGGFGEVWLGWDEQTQEHRVFKFCFRANRVRSLRREVTLFRLLKERVGAHPNIVGVHEVNFDTTPFYLSMDYVPGRDLRAWLEMQGGPDRVPLGARLELVAQVAVALQAAHDAGVIHRDVKPGNILIQDANGSPPTAKLTDFGVGQVVSEDCLSGVTAGGFTQTIVADPASTQAGTQVYMAPEILAGKPASTRSDIYSLGIVLYQFIVGDLSRPLTTDWDKEISDELLRADLRLCFAGDPQERFAGAAQLAAHLRSLDQRHAALEREHARAAALERAAFRRGLLRAGAVASLVVAIVALLALTAMRQSNRAQRLATAMGENLYVADLNLAHRSTREDNLGRAWNLVHKHLPAPGQPDQRGFEWRFLWGVCRGDQDAVLQAHDDAVSCLALSPDGQFLVSGSYDRRVKLWDMKTHRPIRQLATLDHAVSLRGAAYSPDNRVVAAASWIPPVVLWNTGDWKELARLPGASAPIVFSPDGRVFAARIGNAGIRFWDTTTWQPISDLEVSPTGFVLDFSPDSRWLMVTAERKLHLFSWPDLTPAADLDGVENVVSVGFSLSGQFLAVGTSTGTVHLWDWPRRLALASWEVSRSGEVFAVAFSPDNRRLATTSGRSVELWEIPSCRRLVTYRGHQNDLGASLLFSPDGRFVISSSKDRSIRLWSTIPVPKELSLPQAGIPLRFSSDDRTLISMDDATNGNLRVWDVSGLDRLPVQRAHHADLGPWKLAAVAPDGQRMAVARTNGIIEVRELETWRLITQLTGDDPEARSLVFSPDSRLLASVSGIERKPGTLRLWDPASKETRLVIPDAHIQIGHLVAFAPTKNLLGLSMTNRTVEIWDWKLGQRQRILSSPKGVNWWAIGIAFSPDSRLLAAASFDGATRLWDVEAGREIGALIGHRTAVAAVAFSPDGRTLATGSHDNSVKLWHVATLQEIMSFDDMPEPVNEVMFSPRGSALAAGGLLTGSRQRPLWLWRAASIKEIDQTLSVNRGNSKSEYRNPKQSEKISNRK